MLLEYKITNFIWDMQIIFINEVSGIQLFHLKGDKKYDE